VGQSDLNILEIILHSGLIVKSVMLILLFGSVSSWALFFAKKAQFLKAKHADKGFLNIYRGCTSLKEAHGLTLNLPSSPLKIMFDSGYNELSKIKESAGVNEPIAIVKSHFQSMGLGALERALRMGMNSSNVQLEKSLSVLATIGSITPFIGLFGTVWGIIDSFRGLAGGGATLDAVAPGIAEALVATAVGLFAAIPAVWFYNRFNSQLTEFQAEMENFVQDFLNVVERSIIHR